MDQIETTTNIIPYTTEDLALISEYIRKQIFEIVQASSSGHLGGTSSSVELMTTLYLGGYLNFNPENPDDPQRDIVIVRGHLGPLRYPLFSFMGMIPEEDLWHYRTLGGLDGHEVMDTPGVDIAPNGSLGMGLSYGVGAAMVAKVEGKENKTVVFLGDGEMQEGNTLEAIQHAGSEKLENLIVIVDRNRGQLSCRTANIEGNDYDMEGFWRSCGWEVLTIDDGHDITKIKTAYERMTGSARTKPLVIIASTIKGKGLPNHEQSYNGYHSTSACNSTVIRSGIEYQDRIIRGNESYIERMRRRFSSESQIVDNKDVKKPEAASKNIEIEVPTQGKDSRTILVEYVNELKRILENQGRPFFLLTPDFFPLPLAQECGFSQKENSAGTSYRNVGIREQHMMGLAYGIIATCPEAVVMTSTADAFLYRYMDQINAVAQGVGKQRAPNGFGKLLIMSDFAGLTSTTNGYTHTSSGQSGAILHMPGMEILEPMDGIDLVHSLNKALRENSVTVIRNHRVSAEIPPTIHLEDRNLEYYSVIEHEDPDIVMIGSGFTTMEAVRTAENFAQKGFKINLVNIVNLKSLDEKFVQLILRGVPVISVYNGNASVLSSAISRAVFLHGRGLSLPKFVEIGFEFGKTGKQREVVEDLGLDYKSLSLIVESLLKLENP